MILLWESEQGYSDIVPPGVWAYVEFEALVVDCGILFNTANATGYYDPVSIVSDGDTAEVWVCCEEPCDIYATVTYPYYEEVDGESDLAITGTAYNDCTCPEIENVSVAIYYTQDDNVSNPTYYWNAALQQWEITTIIYNSVNYVDGGCPDNILYWDLTIPGPLPDSESTYYIHAVAQPGDQNTGVPNSEFTVGCCEK